MSLGNLHKFMADRKMNFLNEDELVAPYLLVTQALISIHAQGYIHGDIRPKSILLSRKKDGRLDIALDNFASVTAVKAASPGQFIAPDQLLYTAPEVLNGQAPSKKSDVWSMGVTLYVMATGTFPFKTREDILSNQPIEPVTLQDEFWDYIKKLLSKDPAQRPTAFECHGSSD